MFRRTYTLIPTSTRPMLAMLALVTISATATCPVTKCPAQEAETKAAIGIESPDEKKSEPVEPKFLTGVRQLTFEGKRAGEGYYSPDGKQMVFQSERLETTLS